MTPDAKTAAPTPPLHLRDVPDNSPERTAQIERLVERAVEEYGNVIEKLAGR